MDVKKKRVITATLAWVVLLPLLAGLAGCERELFTQKDKVASQRSMYWGDQHSVWENAQQQHQQDEMPIPIGPAANGY